MGCFFDIDLKKDCDKIIKPTKLLKKLILTKKNRYHGKILF